MKKNDIKQAKQLWDELCKSVSKRPSPFSGMSEEDVVKQLRKTRKKHWEEKLATRS